MPDSTEKGVNVTINFATKNRKETEIMFDRETKQGLHSAIKALNILYDYQYKNCGGLREPITEEDTLVSTGIDILGEKLDQMVDEATKELTDDLESEIEVAIDGIEAKYLMEFGGDQIPKDYSQWSGVQNATKKLSKKFAEVLLDELLHGCYG